MQKCGRELTDVKLLNIACTENNFFS